MKNLATTVDKVFLGSVSTCLVSNCTGRYVDSLVGQYYIKCNDPKHLLKEEI